jgi:hypothetical protein
MLPKGGQSAASASALAAVPVETHKASTSVSNRSEKAALSCRLSQSPS